MNTETNQIENMDEFETTVDLALEKQTELEKLQKAAKTAKAKVEAAKNERVSAKQLKAVGISVENAKVFYVAPKDAA